MSIVRAARGEKTTDQKREPVGWLLKHQPQILFDMSENQSVVCPGSRRESICYHLPDDIICGHYVSFLDSQEQKARPRIAGLWV